MNPIIKEHAETTERLLLADIAELEASPDSLGKDLSISMLVAHLSRCREAWRQYVARYAEIRAIRETAGATDA